jgi:hypothetical protein
LLPDVPVQAVRGRGSSFGVTNEAQAVVISLAPPLAERVVAALAIKDVQLRAGVLTGVPPGRADTVLPDIARCAGGGT